MTSRETYLCVDIRVSIYLQIQRKFPHGPCLDLLQLCGQDRWSDQSCSVLKAAELVAGSLAVGVRCAALHGAARKLVDNARTATA